MSWCLWRRRWSVRFERELIRINYYRLGCIPAELVILLAKLKDGSLLFLVFNPQPMDFPVFIRSAAEVKIRGRDCYKKARDE